MLKDWIQIVTNYHALYVLMIGIVIALVALFFHWLVKKIILKLSNSINNKKIAYSIPIAFLQTAQSPLLTWLWLYSLAVFMTQVFVKPFNPFKIILSIMAVTWWILRVIKKHEEYMLEESSNRGDGARSHKTTVIAISRIVKIAIVVFAVILIIQAMHIDVSGILTLGSAGTIVLGIAARDLLANFFGGMMIFTDRQFIVGDAIKSTNKEIDGMVEYIGWRLTRIRTQDKGCLYVPNSMFLTTGIENSSRRDHRQIREIIKIKTDDKDKLQSFFADVRTHFAKTPELDAALPQFIGVQQFGVATIDCLVWCFTTSTDFNQYLEIKSNLLLTIMYLAKQRDLECSLSYCVLQP